MLISVCMLAERCLSASHIPVKNCDPDHDEDRQAEQAEECPNDAPRIAAGRHPVPQARDEIRVAEHHHRHGHDGGKPELPQESVILFFADSLLRVHAVARWKFRRFRLGHLVPG